MYIKLSIPLFLVLIIGCSSIPQTNPLPQQKDVKHNRSILWIKSLEYNLLCQQIFENAKNRFDSLDLKNTQTVIVGTKTVQKLPLAIVTDIDATILINYNLQKKLQEENIPFSYSIFKQYIDLGKAIPIKSAIEYFQYLSKRGIKILYISNRLANTETQTYQYLKKHGYPISSKNDLLLKGEEKDWGSDKSSRRYNVSKRYTVIQMFGDNYKDFVSTKTEALKHKDKFGKSWFIMPNPMYGNWVKNK